MMAVFVLGDYAGQLPECIIERHSGQYPELWAGVRFRIMDDQFVELSLYSPDMSIGTCGIWLVSVAHDPRPAVSKTNFGCIQAMILFLKQIFNICLTPCHVVYGSTYCSAWWLHQILISDA
ncbi:hypothetical protein NPIL_145371 [Nephila pilipes]|uniref:Uncharacterized protein n=1 Tax=Nephila pilipes TaxID=299642 RepID=A0A8X6P0L4_NEPPI|nr:hypothetical protein NPIL_145371 [Nephila pilipes]